eukprot:6514072-Pyramimonas_sp.AAC.1
MGLAVGVAAACVRVGQKAACPTAAAVGLGQHSLLGLVAILAVPLSGVQTPPLNVEQPINIRCWA